MQFWPVAGNGAGRSEPLTTELADGRRAPCVFGFREEVKQFLRLCARRGRRLRTTGIGDPGSVLSGRCGEEGLVAPDSLPTREAAAPNAPLRVDRQRFLSLLLRKVSGR